MPIKPPPNFRRNPEHGTTGHKCSPACKSYRVPVSTGSIRTCTVCGGTGHNKTTCPNKPLPTAINTAVHQLHRLARALDDVLDGVPDHDINPANYGMTQQRCDEIKAIRGWIRGGLNGKIP